MKNSLFEQWQQSLGDHRVWISEGAVWAGVAFVIGFLFKNIGKYLIAATLLTGIALYALNASGMIVIHVDSLMAMFGVDSIKTFDDVRALAHGIIEHHIVGVIGGVIGFIVGWKIG